MSVVIKKNVTTDGKNDSKNRRHQDKKQETHEISVACFKILPAFFFFMENKNYKSYKPNLRGYRKKTGEKRDSKVKEWNSG